MSPRYVVDKTGRRGAGPRFYWSPARELSEAEWETLRLSNDKAAARIEADQLNYQLDQWRRHFGGRHHVSID